MKRFTALLLAGIMLFALCACNGNSSKETLANTEPLTKMMSLQW